MFALANWSRYVRLYLAMARYCIARELAFRINFLTRCLSSFTWMIFVIAFFQMIFLQTSRIGEWSKDEYLFFMGTFFIINGVLDAFFLENCTNFADRIRSGDLDFALLKPVDEQFLLTCERIDWSELPTIVVGIALTAYAASAAGIAVTPARTFCYLVLLAAGVGVLYSCIVVMASSCVWLIQNKSMYEMWFYVNQFSRYPSDIYGGSMAGQAIRFTLMFLLPVLLAVSVPAQMGVKLVSPWLAAYLLVIAIATLIFSRWFFHYALTCYRSASS